MGPPIVTNVQCKKCTNYNMVGGAEGWGGALCGVPGGMPRVFLPSSQFCCEAKTPLKSLLKIK